MVANAVRVLAFHESEFESVICEPGGAPLPRPRQVTYLAKYANRLGARSMVVESFYIDRHYLDEYAAYYSRMLDPPVHAVRRVHLFRRHLSEAELDDAFNKSLSSEAERKAHQDCLSDAYLGFVSIRPLPTVPIGRTVLRRLADDEQSRRDIWATTKHRVHLGNLQLWVDGLAFQQQDLAVGACATAAVWTALSRVARHERMRAPTPAEVSEAAARNVVPLGRTLPAVAGLTPTQMCEAIRATGFAPEAFNAGPKPEAFVVALHTYLLSGIPVVLILRREGEAHAVTAAGFLCEGAPDPSLHSSVQLRSASIKKLYVHDDRLGPYARAHLVPVPRTRTSDEALLLKIDWPEDDEEDDELWFVDAAIAAVYPKMRLPVGSMLTLADLLGDAMERIVGDQKRDLNVEFKYQRGGDYLASLTGTNIGAAAKFVRTVALSRWCGVLRWHLGESIMAEFVYDTTDVLRNHKKRGRELIRAVVCRDGRFNDPVRKLAELLSVPCLPDP